MTDQNEEFINLAGIEDVKSYQRRTSTGQVVTVKGYVRTDNSAVADRAKHSPGRPNVAAATGRFAGDRSLPRVWPDAGKDQQAVRKKDEPEPEQYEGMEDTGVVDQETLDKDIPIALEIMKNLPQNAAMTRLMEILRSKTQVSMSDDVDTIDLSIKAIRISGYSYISKKTGKLVRVDPYTQMRRLINAMGGPTLAAKSGVTADMIDRAMPGFAMRKNIFTPVKKDDKTPSIPAPIAKTQTLLDGEGTPKRISIPAPKPNDTRADVTRKAMSPNHPLQKMRDSKPGTRIVRGKEEWTRGQDNLWYKMPRGRSGAISDKEMTARLANRGGEFDLTPANPINRKTYERSRVMTDEFDPNDQNYFDKMIYAKSMAPSFANMPEGVVDSINGHLSIEKPKSGDPQSYASMTSTRVLKKNGFYPEMVIRRDEDYEDDLMESLPAQQEQGFSAPSDLHPTETRMTYEVARFTEELLKGRAPAKMVDEMYDNLSAVYDKNIKTDDGDYSAFSGRDGWIARMTGDRPQGLKDEIAEKISLSATSSPEEFLAESWVEFVGKAEPRPLAKSMGRAFQKGMDDFSEYLYRNKWVDATEIPEGTYQKTTDRDLSRKIADIMEKTSWDRTVIGFDIDRDMRSTSKIYSVNTQIFDEDGNALFDANIYRDNGEAYIHGLEYPKVDPEAMPDGTPDLSSFVMAGDARYYESPMDSFSPEGRAAAKRKYADAIDQGVALKVIKEIEADLKEKGVTKTHAFPRAHEDSILYARAGYKFDAKLTDADEIRAMFSTLDTFVAQSKQDAKDGWFTLPQGEPAKLRRQLNQWKKNFDPQDASLWPTPEQIADFGKYNHDTSPGEAVLDHVSWAGTKIIGGSTITDRKAEITATDINGAARNMIGDVDDVDGIAALAKKVAKIHNDELVNARAKVTGTPDKHSISIKEGRATLFSVDVTKTDDGWVNMENIHIDGTLAGGRLAFDMMDQLDSTYQKAGMKGVRLSPDKDPNNPDKYNPVSAYALARQFYDWDGTLPGEQVKELAANIEEAKDKQIASARDALYQQALKGRGDLPIESIKRIQKKIDENVQRLDDELTAEVGAVMEKFDDPDPDNHPTPFELSLLGQQKSQAIDAILASLGQDATTAQPSAPYIRPQPGPGRQTPRPGFGTPGPNPGPAPLPTPDPKDVIEERRLWKAKQAGTVSNMLDFDGDPTHDSAGEFIGKQILTFGGYAMLKTMEGYWNWASLDRGTPSVHRESVGLLFILLRLMPASLARGAIMMTATTMTKRLKSPKPEDWPSQQEIDVLIERIREQGVKEQGETK